MKYNDTGQCISVTSGKRAPPAWVVLAGALLTIASSIPCIAYALDEVSSSRPTAAHLSPAAQARYRDTIQRGCSTAWALNEARAADMDPAVARIWIGSMSRNRLKRASRYLSHLPAKQQEEYARALLADFKCGAAPADDEDVDAVMSILADSLERDHNVRNAETIRREDY
jgi:hypothetical protein